MSNLLKFIFIRLILLSYCNKNNDNKINECKYVAIFYMSGNNNLRNDIENANIKLQKGYTENIKKNFGICKN